MWICTRSFRLLLLTMVTFSLFAPMASAEVAIDWVTVGDPGNAADDTGYGSVGYLYQISKYEVTNAQYAEFLNAVAVTDTYGLYGGSIGRLGSSGSYTYIAVPGREDWPVDWVSFWDATRFANWLHNGQPTGAQDNTTTEDGAYTLTPTGIANNTVTRNAEAKVFVPSEDEWYKAAYYDPGATIYFDYPAGSDTQTTCAVPGATANTANCDQVSSLANVGSYTGSASPNGTFDQGGNLFEWTEAIREVNGSFRGLRGGYYWSVPTKLRSSWWGGETVAAEHFAYGFRVASVVSVPLPALGPLAIAVLLTLLGATAYWRLHASAAAA